MMKVRKKLFTLSGLFMVLAQVFVAAFCGITAIAVTQEETTQSLYSNEYGSAAMSYELLENDRIKWTLTLAKTEQLTATQFMVDLAVDGTLLVPENVTSEGISLMGASSNGHIQAGLSETASTMGGSGTVTFETAREIGTLTATPQLITSVEVPVETPVTAMAAEVTTETPSEEAEAVQPAEEPPVQTETVVTNLLDGVGQTTFAIPDVEVVEEINPVEPTDPNTPENDGGEETGVEDPEVPNDMNNVKDTENTDKSNETQEKESHSNEVILENQVARVQSGVPYSEPQNNTAIRFEKTWKDMPANVPKEAQTVQVQIKRKLANGKWEIYKNPNYDLTIKYEDATNDGQGNMVTVGEWHNLPLYANGQGPYEYMVEELPSSYYEMKSGEVVNSSVEKIEQVTSNSSTEWKYDSTGFIVASIKGQWFIWTADPVIDKSAFIKNIKEYPGKVEGGGASFGTFIGTKGSNPATLENTIWATGSIVDEEHEITTVVSYNDDGGYTTKIIFAGGTSIWTQFFYGGHTTKMVPVTNTYIPQNDVTVKKIWDDRENAYNTREDIRLELQRYNASLPGDTEDDKWEAVAAHDIGKGATIPALLQKTFTVPSKVDGETALYRVIEKVRNDEGEYTGAIVPGYAAPDIGVTSDEITNNVTYTVTNTLLKANFSFEKVGNDGSTPLENVGFTLTRDGGGYENSVTSTKAGSVTFNDLPIGTYTLTETSTVNGYKLGGNWQVSVTDSNNDGVLEVNSPFALNNGILVNELKPFDLIVNKKDDLGKDLVGAEFTLTKLEDSTFKKVLSKDDNQDPISQFVFKDLTPGTYTLEETKAPDGYAKLTETITIIISELGVVDVKYSDSKTGIPANVTLGANDSANTITFSVANKKKVPLPATGGSGTMMFVTIGVLALTATGLYFLKRKDQEVA